MTRIVRNALVCLALAALAYAVTLFVDIEAFETALPRSMPFRSRELAAVGLAFSLGVFLSGAALVLLVQSKRPWYWVIAYCVLWFLAMLFPQASWREISVGQSVAGNVALGAVSVWPAALVFVAGLLGARIAVIVFSRAQHAGA